MERSSSTAQTEELNRASPAPLDRGLLLLFLLVLTGACSGPAQPQPLSPAPAAARPAAQLILPRLGGGQVSLQAQSGTPVLITLFTTWCLRCQLEAPLFNQLRAAYAGRLRVLGIALDVKTRPAIVKTYVEFVKFGFDVALAQPDNLELVEALGQTRRVPRTVLLDQRGVAVLDQVGQTDVSVLKRALERILPPGVPARSTNTGQ